LCRPDTWLNTFCDLTNAPKQPQTSPLLPEELLVESELLTLEDVAVGATGLAGARRDNGVQATGLELLLDSGVDLAGGGKTLRLLLGDGVGLLDVLGLLARLGLPPAAQGRAVVGLVPLPEGSGIDLNNGGAGQGVGTDELVVGRVVDDTDDTGLLGDTLGTPGEVTGIETESAELAVAAAGADEVDTLSANTGVGRLAALLESPEAMLETWLEMRSVYARSLLTSSCGSMRASHRKPSACGESHERYWRVLAVVWEQRERA
jgi:hypothetical protein